MCSVIMAIYASSDLNVNLDQDLNSVLLGMSDERKKRFLECSLQLIESKHYEGGLGWLYNMYRHIGDCVTEEDCNLVTTKLIATMKLNFVSVRRSIIDQDPLICPQCFCIFYGAVSRPCGHSVCCLCTKLSSQCPICLRSNASEGVQGRLCPNILQNHVVKKSWLGECEGIEVRNEANGKLEERNYGEAAESFGRALMKCEQ